MPPRRPRVRRLRRVLGVNPSGTKRPLLSLLEPSRGGVRITNLSLGKAHPLARFTARARHSLNVVRKTRGSGLRRFDLENLPAELRLEAREPPLQPGVFEACDQVGVIGDGSLGD